MDIRTGLAICGFIIVCILQLISIVKSYTIQNNDLKHMNKKMDKMCDKIDAVDQKVDINTAKISQIKGYLDGIKE